MGMSGYCDICKKQCANIYDHVKNCKKHKEIEKNPNYVQEKKDMMRERRNVAGQLWRVKHAICCEICGGMYTNIAKHNNSKRHFDNVNNLNAPA